MCDPDLKDLIGIPFLSGGRDPHAGLDCWGLCREVYACYGVALPDFAFAAYDALGICAIASDEAKSPRWQPLDTPAAPCVAAMAIDPDWPGRVQHLGVYIGRGRIIHTLENRGASLILVGDRFWKNKIKGYYRWNG